MRLTLVSSVVLLAGCEGVQSALDPKGPDSAALAWLIWFFTWVSAAIFALVMLALLAAVLWRRRAPPPVDPLATDSRKDRRAGFVVGGAVGATVLILLLLTGISFFTQQALTAPQQDELVIRVTGHQWWWDVRYEDPVASQTFTTANEIHIPTGRPVVLKLTSRDVIHSFWVPNLTGKKDLIPGYTAETWLQADAPGVYRGQCAEFCGHQHAKMAMEIVAHPPAEYERWASEQRTPAAAPADSLHAAGQQVFMTGSCALCHTIAGTRAGGRVGPDLTHLASRRTIAAGTLPNTRGHLAGWILDPQRIKPGAYMPANGLEPAQLDALLAYLTSLR